MQAPTISVLGYLLGMGGALRPMEERATWSLRGAVGSPIPFHQFVGAEEPSTALEEIAEWAGWNGGDPLLCESTSDSLKVVTTCRRRVWAVALWNCSHQKVKVQLGGELPSGVYTTERLTLETGGAVAAVERRNGVRLLATGNVRRTEWLHANSGLILRFVERTEEANSVLGALRRSVWRSKVSRGVLSRLASLMREIDSHWYQVRANLRRGNLQLSARGVHRMLFLASGMRATASKYIGSEEVVGHAEQLVDSLSELSSALLNITVSVRREGEGIGVQVVNAGASQWTALRLAMGSAETDTAVLANVRPMERAETAFRLPDGQISPEVVVSVLFNNGYARVKVRATGLLVNGQRQEEER